MTVGFKVDLVHYLLVSTIQLKCTHMSKDGSTSKSVYASKETQFDLYLNRNLQ
jgi:hypothetical protein